MNAARQNNNDGFTLLEVLVALGIMLIGILGAMQMFPVSLLQAKQATERSDAASTADSVFGDLRMASAEALFEDKVPVEILEQLEDWDDRWTGYTVTVQPLPGAEDTQLQRVTLVVILTDGRKETFVTYVSKR